MAHVGKCRSKFGITGKSALCVGRFWRAIGDFNKEGCFIDIKREGVCDMCEEYNSVMEVGLGP